MKHIVSCRMTALAAALVLILLLCGCGTSAQTAVPYVTEPPAEISEITAPEERLTETMAEPTTEPPTETTTEEPTETAAPETTTEAAAEGEAQEYVVNTNTGKFHYPDCSSVKDMKAKNRSDRVCTRDELIDAGYVPCKRCNP